MNTVEKLYENINSKLNQCIGQLTVLSFQNADVKEVHGLLIEIASELDDSVNGIGNYEESENSQKE